MKKSKKLQLNRETLRHLITPDQALRQFAGGVNTLPATDCAASICVASCIKCASEPPLCSVKDACNQ
jgi:hypothetical protein